MSEPSWRKPVGMGLILLLILVWTVIVASASDLLTGLPWPVHALYYGVAGIVWRLPRLSRCAPPSPTRKSAASPRPSARAGKSLCLGVAISARWPVSSPSG